MHTPVPANKIGLFGTYSTTTRHAPYLHPSHDSILELWRTFPNVINAEDLGKTQMNEFIAKRMKSTEVRFWDTLPHLKLPLFETLTKTC